MSEPSDTETLRLSDSARAWIPRLEARADEVEQARRLPDDLARELASEGFYRMWVPSSLGGLEFPLVPSLEVLDSLLLSPKLPIYCCSTSPSASNRAFVAQPVA